MFTISDFPSIFSFQNSLSLEATAFTRAVIRLVGTDHAIRDCWEEFRAAEMPVRGARELSGAKQVLRVHYRLCHRGPRVVKFYFFVKVDDGDRSEWKCVGETGPRGHINAPREDEEDIRWY